METEKNKATLEAAIRSLPVHSAPEGLWVDIEQHLAEADQFDQMSKAARELPVHPAPDHLWNSIASDLEKPGALHRPLWRRPSVQVAASLLILIMAVGIYQWRSTSSALPITVSVDQEMADPTLLVSDWDTEEVAVAEVVQLYQNYLNSFPDRSERNWLEEYQELSQDRRDLKAAMDRYGRDAQMINQLADIERERAKILKRMAQQI